MNTRTKVTRFIFALALALSAIGISTSTALADRPIKSEYTFTWEADLYDICTFPIHIAGVNTHKEIDFFDQSGALTRMYIHVDQQDTYSNNGITLPGLPYSANVEYLFDSSGNVTNINANGVFEKVPLPDGTLFISAGRVDFMDHPGVGFLISPDMGHSGNLDAFCAALE